MRFLNWKGGLVLGALFLARPAMAQDGLAAPTGWTQSASAGDLIYSKSDGCRLTVKRLVPLSGGLRSWFAAQVARDGARRGEVVSRGAIQSKAPALTTARSFQGARGGQFVVYVGYPVGNQGRLMLFSGPNQGVVLRSVGELNALGARLGARDERLAKGGAKNGGRVAVRSQSGGKITKMAPVAARGTLKASQIAGVYLNEGYTTGVGGMTIIEYTPVLLLRDGSARRDLEIPPLDVNLANDKRAAAEDWGRWSKSGGKLVVRWSDGDKDELKPKFKTRPAAAGRTLNDTYSTIGGGGNTALGGSVMTFYSNEYRFFPNGVFTTDKSGGGSSSDPNFGDVTALSKSKNGGRYRLDGHALTLRFGDGRVVRRLFYFFPDSTYVVGIGDSTFIGEKKGK